MNKNENVTIFGEALFDCFDDGITVLGGAPFNVAWHLQAFGDKPEFISRVGHDELGRNILKAMSDWGLSTHCVQVDELHKTGQVNVELINNEPNYDIATDVAYDFIDFDELEPLPTGGLLYHGTLATRSQVSSNTLRQLVNSTHFDVFVDVNLRSPWWNKLDTYQWLESASWVKLNKDEMEMLGFKSADLYQDMTRLHNHFHLQQLIVTCGKEGAIVRDEQGAFHTISPQTNNHVVDTVGAGDAFTAMYIHGLRAGWSVEKILNKAQEFASKVVGLKGATTQSTRFYQNV